LPGSASGRTHCAPIPLTVTEKEGEMKMKGMKSVMLLALSLVFVSAGLCVAGAAASVMNPGAGKAQNTVLLPSANSTLDENEIEGLLQMREEEKLARDVYLKMYEKWGKRVFKNIVESEQRHMDAVLSLLKKYNLTDPAAENSVGEFENTTIQDLYDDLVAAGSVSLVEALRVGVDIEELDIEDLQNFLDNTDNPDIKTVYQNLLEGSLNHLSAFTFQLDRLGATY
jgi:hypothetical protein